MNQIQTLIDAAREALTSNGIHDTILPWASRRSPS